MPDALLQPATKSHSLLAADIIIANAPTRCSCPTWKAKSFKPTTRSRISWGSDRTR